MQEKSDAELLREYAAHANEAAFREIVTRHADLVYASALRQARSPELARDIAQTVFADLVRKAPALAQSLAENGSLVGWLYRSTRFEAHTQMRDDRRRQARERQAMQDFDSTPDTATEWERVGPVLDEAMADLNDEDRDALLLRFFKNHDFRTIGVALGVSDDAAQKRVSRALERLRAGFNRRGVTTTAVALATVLSANAVAVGPAGLAATLSTAALTGTTLATTATATATKAIAMTTLQKTIIGATLAVAVGTGIYEARQASHLHEQNQALQQQQAPLAEQVQQLSQALTAATNQVAALRNDNERLSRNSFELLKLRGEVAVLRSETQDSKPIGDNPLAQQILQWKTNETTLRQLFNRRPEQRVPELQLLDDRLWLDIARDADLSSEDGIRQAMSQVRQFAKNRFAPKMMNALKNYIRANNEQLPDDIAQLKPYFESTVDDSVLHQYKLLHTGKMADLPSGPSTAIVTDISVVDKIYDKKWLIGMNWFGLEGTETKVLHRQ